MKGHIYKPGCKCPKGGRCRCNAKWGFMVDVGIDPATGKRKQKFKGGFGTKKEAEEALSSFLVELSGNGFSDPSKMTFNNLKDEWLEWFTEKTRRKNGKPRTVEARTYQAERLAEKLGFARIKSITQKQYQDALESLKKDKKHNHGPSKELSDNSMIGIHAAGKMIFEYAVEKKYLKENPTTYASPVRKKKTVADIESRIELPKYMEKEELKLFLEGSLKYGLAGDALTFHVLAYSGLRVGEYCALDFPSLDFAENTLRVTKTLFKTKDNELGYELVAPKTVRSIRKIKMDSEVMKMLYSAQIEQKKYKLQFPDYPKLQFVSAVAPGRPQVGHPQRLNAVNYRMKRILKLVGLNPNLSPHSLRHTHVSLLAEAGVPLEVIMDRLGHADDAITKLIYMHVTKDLKEEAAEKFSTLMSGLR